MPSPITEVDDGSRDEAERVATSLQTTIAGAFFQRTTVEDPDLEPVRKDAHAYLDRYLRE